MKIAFESQLLLNGNKTGIAWCADNLIRGIAKSTDYECQLNYFSKGCDEEKLAAMREYQAVGAKLKPCGFFKMPWYKFIWLFLPLPYHWFFRSDCQITQFFNYVIPPGVKGKKVTFIYDMVHYACRDTMRLKNRIWLDLTLKQSCQRADIVLTISEFSKSEIIKYLKVPEEKIRVIYMGVDLELFHDGYAQAEIEQAKVKYKISGEYILYLGTIEPRKNLQRLIEAYELLVRSKRAEDLPKLVLAGGKGWLCDDIYRAAEKPELQGKVLFAGYIDEQDSPLLLSGAKFFCFPSLYEGFGMPPIEAMACGTPVLAGEAASLPEVIGNAGVLVNPYSVEEISEAMKNLIEDEKQRKDLAQRGLRRAEQFAWQNSVNTLKNIYETLMNGEE